MPGRPKVRKRDADYNVTDVLGIATDVTDLNLAQTKTEAASLAKTDFLSHTIITDEKDENSA